MSLQLKVTLQGQVSYLPLNESGLAFAAQPGAIYTLVDESGEAVTDDLELIRQQDDLDIVCEGETVAEIDGFYAGADNAALYWVEGGELPVGADASADVAGTFIAGSDLGAEAGVVWGAAGAYEMGVMSLAALVGGGLVINGVMGSDDSDASTVDASSYNLNLTAVAGTFTSIVSVTVYDQSGNLLYSGESDMSSGAVSLTINSDYSGPILVMVSDANGTDGDYIDETSGLSTSLGTSLSAMATADGSGDVSVSVTPLTELAVREAGVDSSTLSDATPLTTDDVAMNDQIGELFGVDDILGDVVTVLDTDYDTSDGTSAAETYGEVLASLSGADDSTGSIDATLDILEEAIVTVTDGDLTIREEGVELVTEGADTYETETSTTLSSTVFTAPVIDAAVDGISATKA